MTDTGLELGPSGNDISVKAFAKENHEYYVTEFGKIQGTTGFAWSWNTMAAVLGPLWGAARGAWGFFWTFLVLELLPWSRSAAASGANSAPINWRNTKSSWPISQSGRSKLAQHANPET